VKPFCLRSAFRKPALIVATLACIYNLNTAVRAASDSDGSLIRRIRTDRQVEVYEPGEPVNLRVTVLNPSGDKPLEGAKLVWRIATWSHLAETESPAGESSVSIPAGENTVIRVSYEPDALGWHEIVFELRDVAGILLDRRTRAFSVGSAPRSTGHFFHYGICQNLRRYLGTPMFGELVTLADRLGIDSLRTEIASWKATEPEPGQWNWKPADQVVEALSPLGIEIQPILAYSPRWASTGDINSADWNDWNKAAPRLEPWLGYVSAVVGRYGDRLHHWEIWNEPDISFWRSPTERYVELFGQTSALIKKLSPGASVLNGGFAMGNRPPNPDFLEKFIATADQSHWDVFAYHDYHTFAQFLTRREKVRAFQSALRPDLPVWINEGGFHTLLAGGERAQALTLVKKITSAPAQGISAYFWYNLHDDGTDPKDPEDHFGLTRNGGEPKPAWSAYQNLIRELGNARYVSSMPSDALPAGAWGHLYASHNDDKTVTHTLVLWQEGAERQTPVWLGVGPSARVVSIVDSMGNPVPVTLAQHGAVLSLTDEPVYVHLHGESDGAPRPILKAILDTPAMVVLVPGMNTPLPVTINNPLDTPADGSLVFSSDDPRILPQDQPGMVRLPASGSVRVTGLVAEAEPAPNAVASRDPSRVTLHLSIPGAGLEMEARVPVAFASRLPAVSVSGDFWGAEAFRGLPPFATLDRRDDIFNLYSAEPLPAMQWHGSDDLSASARIADDGGALLLEVVVHDDTHSQADIGGRLWEGDSLQVGICMDDTGSSYIEIGLARDDAGKVGGWVFSRTPGDALPIGRLDKAVARNVVRDASASTTTYRLRLPWKLIGGPFPDGFRLTFIANDNDGKGRKQWVKLSNGMGEQKAPPLWPVFVTRPQSQ
jgi:hypothetical protein